MLDMDVVTNAIKFDAFSKARLIGTLKDKTELENPNSVAQMKDWLSSKGVDTESLDKKAVLAGINYMEFRYREADFSSYPKGLMYGLDIMGDWLYDDRHPFVQVQQLAVFEKLKAAIDEGYFEKLIQTWLLDNTHGAILTLVPKKGLAAVREKALEEKLEAYRSSCHRSSWRKWSGKRKLWRNTRKQRKDRKIWNVSLC